MKRVPIAQLKARLSAHLKAVMAGEEIIVTDRGRPVARLAPITGEAGADARLDELIRAGIIRAPIRSLPDDFWSWPRPADPAGRGLAALLEERAEGR